jgi:hypothetical protein
MTACTMISNRSPVPLYATLCSVIEMVKTSLALDSKTKKELDALKVHPRETYDQLLMRMVAVMKEAQKP